MVLIKKLLALGIFLVASHLVNAQEPWYVMYVEGTIKLKSSGEILKSGSQITIGEKLVFETPEAFADVLTFSEGRKVLRMPKPEDKNKPTSEVVIFVKNILAPSEKTMGSRGEALNNIPDIQNHFGRETYLILGGTTQVKINPYALPMSDTFFFYVRYDYEGESIIKKLDFRGDTLILSKSTLFMIDNKTVDAALAKNLHLYYYNAKKEKSLPIALFSPIFPEDNKLKEELDVMVSLLKKGGSPNKEIIKEAKTFLNQRYGHFYEENFSNWFCKHFRICQHL